MSRSPSASTSSASRSEESGAAQQAAIAASIARSFREGYSEFHTQARLRREFGLSPEAAEEAVREPWRVYAAGAARRADVASGIGWLWKGSLLLAGGAALLAWWLGLWSLDSPTERLRLPFWTIALGLSLLGSGGIAVIAGVFLIWRRGSAEAAYVRGDD